MPLNLEQRIEAIEQRNQRVELDKAWERSSVRLVSIAGVTYVCASAVLIGLQVERPWLNSLIPTLGFVLSVQSLPMLKRYWIKRQLNRHRPSDHN